jgi:hypothetical protein
MVICFINDPADEVLPIKQHKKFWQILIKNGDRIGLVLCKNQ